MGDAAFAWTACAVLTALATLGGVLTATGSPGAANMAVACGIMAVLALVAALFG